MANQNHTRAFVFGAVLGGVAAAAYAIWNAPKSGAALREEIANGFESAIYRVMRMDQAGATTGAPTAAASLPTTDPPSQRDGGADIVIDGPRPIEITN